MRTIVLVMLATMLPAGVAAQRKAPSFLAAEPGEARVTTRHLRATAEGDVRVSADGRATVSVLVTPLPGMQVYAPDVSGYVPFSLSVGALPGVSVGKVMYPPSETSVFAPTGETSRVYTKPFVVKQPISLDAATRKALLAGTPLALLVTLQYQACDDRVCYRPASGTFSVDLMR